MSFEKQQELGLSSRESEAAFPQWQLQNSSLCCRPPASVDSQ